MIEPETRPLWLSTFGPNGTATDLNAIFDAGAEGRDLFWYAYSSLPAGIKKTLEAEMPGHRGDAIVWLKRLQEELGEDVENGSFLRTIRRYLVSDQAHRLGGPFAQIARVQEDSLQHRLAADPDLALKLRSRLPEMRRIQTAKRAWNNGLGRVSLAIETSRDGQHVLRIGSLTLPARKTKTGWEITVPRERVRHPAWNPLFRDVVEKYARSGVREKDFPGVVGLDGMFYLTDKNHRFAVDPRAAVKILIQDPPSTASLNSYFQLVGIPDPTAEQIVELYEGKIRLQNIYTPDQWSRAILAH